MRNITFRAWAADEEKFVFSDQDEDRFFFWEFRDGSPSAFRFINEEATLDEPAGVGTEAIDNIQQYTGVLDKNENSIYEGDILEFEEIKSDDPDEKEWYVLKYRRAVKFEHGEFMWASEDGEIIGNIYENPELLEKP